MRVFVTGASGFIGKRLVPRLQADGHVVTALLLADEVAPSWRDVRIVRGDITSGTSLIGVMDGQDAVIHLAGAVGYGQTFERCNAINRDGTRHVAAESVTAGVRRFVHMSSVSVYGRPAGVTVTESSPLEKINDPYGDTKIDAEHIVSVLAAEGKLDLTIVRPTVIYGPGDDKFLPKMVENLRAGRARIIGPGTNIVDAFHVDDAVDFLARVLVDPRAVGGIYNLSNPDNPTWNELIALVAAAVGVPPPRQHLPYPVAWCLAAVMEAVGWMTGKSPLLTRYGVRVIGKPYFYSLDRAHRELGYSPTIDLREGVRRYFTEGGESR